MRLDVATLDAIEIMVGVELSLLMAALLLLGRIVRAQAGLEWWVLGTVGATLGRLSTVDLGVGAPAVVGVAGSGLHYLGLAFVWVGARDFCGVPRSFRPVWVGCAAVVLAAGLGADLGAAVLCAAGGAISVSIAFTFATHAPDRQREGSRLAAALYAGLGLYFLCRFYIRSPWMEGLPFAGFEWPREVASFSAIFFHVAWIFTAVGLTSQRLLLRLRDAAHSDGLTGLANRRALRESGGRVLDMCRRRGRPCGVLIIDLDRFKPLNDTFGHAAGDAALRHFAGIASASLDRGGLVGRWGGEEFCLVLPGASRARARRAAQHLRRSLAASPVSFGGREFPLTVSVGVAWARGPELDFERMIARADEALYRAKDEGRDRVREAA